MIKLVALGLEQNKHPNVQDWIECYLADRAWKAEAEKTCTDTDVESGTCRELFKCQEDDNDCDQDELDHQRQTHHFIAQPQRVYLEDMLSRCQGAEVRSRGAG